MMRALKLALLAQNPRPDEAQVLDALGGVLCRCTGYRKIVEAILAVAASLPTNRNSGSEDLKIVQLFDALDKMDDYDEALLLKKTKNLQKQ